MTFLRDRGVVLRTYRLGEADRIIVFLTEGHGKVRAVAKGVRRTGSKFGARLEPMSHVALLAWQGRGDLGVVSQVEVVDHHRRIREDLDRMTSGLSMLEVADQLAQEGYGDAPLYGMLVGALRALGSPGRDPTMVAPAFFVKALALEGASPVVDGCAACGGRPPGVELVAFDMVEGGALCRGCRRGRPISGEALEVLRRILGGSVGSVLAGVPPECAGEVAGVANEAMECHLERRLKTVRSVAGY